MGEFPPLLFDLIPKTIILTFIPTQPQNPVAGIMWVDAWVRVRAFNQSDGDVGGEKMCGSGAVSLSGGTVNTPSTNTIYGNSIQTKRQLYGSRSDCAIISNVNVFPPYGDSYGVTIPSSNVDNGSDIVSMGLDLSDRTYNNGTMSLSFSTRRTCSVTVRSIHLAGFLFILDQPFKKCLGQMSMIYKISFNIITIL